jgi:hypothetical protein
MTCVPSNLLGHGGRGADAVAPPQEDLPRNLSRTSDAKFAVPPALGESDGERERDVSMQTGIKQPLPYQISDAHMHTCKTNMLIRSNEEKHTGAE